MTYDSLVADIASYAERADVGFTGQIPRFIMLAENRIATEVRGLGQLKIVSGTLNGSVIRKPNRWRETANIKAIIGGKYQDIYERTYEYCRKYAPDPSVLAPPKYYADYGYEHWLIVPTPDSAYAFETSYYERPEPLSESNQTNWTTRNAPQLILYATLLEAQPYLKLDGRVQTFTQFYDQAKSDVAAEAKRRAFDRSSGVRE